VSLVEESIASTPLPLLLEEHFYVGLMPNFDLILAHYFPAILQVMKQNSTAYALGKNTYVFQLNDGRYFTIGLEDKAIVKLSVSSRLK